MMENNVENNNNQTKADQGCHNHKKQSMPVIGVTAVQDNSADSTRVKHLYTNKIEEMGGIPLVIPNPSPQVAKTMRDQLMSQDYNDSYAPMAKVPGEFARKYLGSILDKLDGLLLTGGDDPDPVHYGEDPLPGQGGIEPERDILEINLIALALEREIPILGICRGMQSLNVTLGGSNYQDIASQYHDKMDIGEQVKHSQKAPRSYPTHEIAVAEETRVGELIGYPNIRVNTFHHQAVKEPGDKLVATAWARDGIIEAVEMISGLFCVGVQWHPEGHHELPGGDELFKALVKESAGAGSVAAKEGYFLDFNTAHSCGCCNQENHDCC